MKQLLLVLAITSLAFPAYAQTTLYSNSATGNVGIGTATPLGLLTVYGANTVASAASATLDYISVPAATTTITGSTGITTSKGFNAASIYKSTYTDSSSVTITNAATLYIDNAPAAAGSVTITNPWAISVGAGNVSFPGTGNVLGTITSGTWNGNAINLSSYASGTLQAAQEPAHTGDVTNSAGSLATTVAAIQGTTVSGTTGSGNVVFSVSPTLTGTLTAAVANVSGSITDTQAINATSTDGLVLTDTTAATSGSQKWSPRIHFTGQGWKTNTTSGSQTVDVIEELQPVQGTANPSGNLIWSSQVNGGGYGALMALTTGGNVGIGTTGPVAMLHVYTNGDTSPRAIRISGTDANGYAEIQIAGDSEEYRIGVGGSTSGAANDLYFYDNNAATTRILITSAGNVGIGTTSPSFPLDVNGTVNATQIDVHGSQLSCAGLSDCTTGSWTPTDQSGASLSLTVTHAEYKKIGNQMCVQALLTYPSTASGAVAELGGLPANVEANGYSPAILETNASIRHLFPLTLRPPI